MSTHNFHSGVCPQGCSVQLISNALCYFIDEMMKTCCLDPQIRRPPGTSVLLTLCLSAISPAAALLQRVWRTTRMSYGSLKLPPALTQNGGYNPSPVVCLLVSVSHAQWNLCVFSYSQFLSVYIYWAFNLKLCVHCNLLNTFTLQIISQAESEICFDVVGKIHIIQSHFRYTGIQQLRKSGQ